MKPADDMTKLTFGNSKTTNYVETEKTTEKTKTMKTLLSEFSVCLEYSDTRRKHFGSKRIQDLILSDKMTIPEAFNNTDDKVIKDLKDYQVQAICLGYTLDEVSPSWFSAAHVAMLKEFHEAQAHKDMLALDLKNTDEKSKLEVKQDVKQKELEKNQKKKRHSLECFHMKR